MVIISQYTHTANHCYMSYTNTQKLGERPTFITVINVLNSLIKESSQGMVISGLCKAQEGTPMAKYTRAILLELSTGSETYRVEF